MADPAWRPGAAARRPAGRAQELDSDFLPRSRACHALSIFEMTLMESAPAALFWCARAESVLMGRCCLALTCRRLDGVELLTRPYCCRLGGSRCDDSFGSHCMKAWSAQPRLPWSVAPLAMGCQPTSNPAFTTHQTQSQSYLVVATQQGKKSTTVARAFLFPEQCAHHHPLHHGGYMYR